MKNIQKEMIEKNEKEFAKELREKYDESIIQDSYTKLKKMSKEELEYMNALTTDILTTLKDAFLQGNPESELAKKVCAMHKEWICLFWPRNIYSPKAHLALVESYLSDERFINYYDQVGMGCTQFLYEAMKLYYQ